MNTRSIYVPAAVFFLCAGLLLFWGLYTDANFGSGIAPQPPSTVETTREIMAVLGSSAILGAAALILGFLYFTPTIIASKRRHRQRTAIRILNILLGWTLLGWVAATVWAYTSDVEKEPT